MTIADNFAMELQHEGQGTIKMLAAIPDDQLDWQPHEKAFSAKGLGQHIAEMFGWFRPTLHLPELDFKSFEHKPAEINSSADLVKLAENGLADAMAALKDYPDEKMMVEWTMRDGDQVFFTMPRVAVVRSSILNHLYHHRGQLSTYIRSMGAAVPGVYGPSADELQ